MTDVPVLALGLMLAAASTLCLCGAKAVARRTRPAVARPDPPDLSDPPDQPPHSECVVVEMPSGGRALGA